MSATLVCLQKRRPENSLGTSSASCLQAFTVKMVPVRAFSGCAPRGLMGRPSLKVPVHSCRTKRVKVYSDVRGQKLHQASDPSLQAPGFLCTPPLFSGCPPTFDWVSSSWFLSLISPDPPINLIPAEKGQTESLISCLLHLIKESNILELFDLFSHLCPL